MGLCIGVCLCRCICREMDRDRVGVILVQGQTFVWIFIHHNKDAMKQYPSLIIMLSSTQDWISFN